MKYIFILLFFASSVTTKAQLLGYQIVKDAESFKVNFSNASKKWQSVESDFIQVKQMNLIKEKLSSKGKFYYKQSNKVRIEYQSPYKYIMVINNNQMSVKDENKTSNYNTKSNKVMQSVNNIMLDCMKGTVFSNKEFKTQAFENAKEYALVMMPQSASMKRFFARIEVYLSKQSYEVLRINMVEQGGDYSLMTFNNRIMNKTLNESIFSIN